MRKSENDPYVRLARSEDARAINQIYRLVQIEPERFLELSRLTGEQAERSAMLRSVGGFISPPDKRDLNITLKHGLVLVYVQDEKLLGYYRFVTRPDKVFKELCAEFLVAPSDDRFEIDSFQDWSGNRKKMSGKTLKKVHWTNREQAALAFNTVRTSLDDTNSARVAWAVDAAVHPERRSTGISRALVKRMHSEFSPTIRFSIFRIFEICKINDVDFNIENQRSTHTFVNSASHQFAYTEEIITLNRDVTLRVRWNYWLKHY